MKLSTILFLILFVVSAVPSSFADDGIFGLQFIVEVGTVQNNLFNLYEDGGLTETMNLGTNWYVDAMLRFFVWRFFLSGRAQGYMYNNMYNIYTILEKWAFEVSLGFFPWDFLSVEIGWNYNRIGGLAVPYQYTSQYNNLFFRVTGKIGNVK